MSTDEERARFDDEVVPQLRALRGFALKLTRSRVDAEDLVSETIVRALERWTQYRPGTNIRSWLFTILYHQFIGRWRRIDTRELAYDFGAEGAGVEETAIGEADPERRFYDSFIDEEITRAVHGLPEEYRTAVILSDVEDLRYAEIAQRLGVPEGTVKSRLFRGRRLLQQKLARYARELGLGRRDAA